MYVDAEVPNLMFEEPLQQAERSWRICSVYNVQSPRSSICIVMVTTIVQKKKNIDISFHSNRCMDLQI